MDPKLPASAESVPANDEKAASSVAPVQETVSTPAPAEPEQGKDQPVETAKTPLDIVRDVISQKKPDDPAPAKDVAEVKPEDTAAKLDKPAESAAEVKDDDEDKPQPFDKHPRFRKALRRAAEAEEKLKTLEPDAAEFRKIDTFMRNAGLSPQEAETGYQVMALMKNAPRDAVPILESMLSELKRTVGDVLPPDLVAKVETGAMTEEAALEVSRARFDKTHAERVAAATRDDSAAQVSAARQRTIVAAVEAEVAQTSQADPNWAVKQQLVADRSRALVMQAPPKTPEDAVRLFKQAVTEVNAALGAVAPKPELQKIVPVPPRTAVATPAAVPAGAQPRPVAKTPLEVVEGVLSGRR